ncbi:MAG TPA: T9SS type A sorting domain-containing protein [Candidatus Udaeobacter sp.]|nr:T9SS type A sorting domain-containing protein [Candidatus Udaeobacter sp.]
MSALQSLLGAGLLTLTVATTSDQPVPAGYRVSRPAAPHSAIATALPAFAQFGWVSPPVESTTAARIAELTGAGLNLLLPAWADSGFVADNLRRLDLASANGGRCLIWDRRFERYSELDSTSSEATALLDSIVSTYRDHPGFAGYYLGDEPPTTQFPLLERLFRELASRDPAHPAYNDLPASYAIGGMSSWTDYVRAYLNATGARVFSYNEYDFLTTGDRGLFIRHLSEASAIAREYGIPFWPIVQLIQHGTYRALTDGELRWQVSMALAYSANGVGYFTYWTPAPDPAWNWQYGLIGPNGERTHWYDLTATLDPRVGAAGRQLARFQWIATEHAGSVPPFGSPFVPNDWLVAVEGRAAIGMYADSIGTRYALAVNSDSAAAQSVALILAGARRIDRLSDDGQVWNAVAAAAVTAGSRVTLDLTAGDFALLRIEGPGAPVRTGAGPALRVSPNPASQFALLELAGVRAEGTIDILDSSGRRIWHRALSPGTNAVVWDGRDDHGSLARAGIYFARARDSGGVTTSRLTWLRGR